MCGIIAYHGRRQAAPILVNGLRRLEYRGYDSAGLAIRSDSFDVQKRTGKVAELESSLPAKMPGTIGIAHTRWATHGGVTDENAHPHLGPEGRVVIVHNGIIENATRIRRHLERQGATFRSETDSEVIAHRLEQAIDKGQSPLKAMRTALKGLRGTWGVCALFLDHDELVCARNGSPLVMGETEHGLIVTSDPQPLAEHTDRVIILEDGDIATFGNDGLSIERLEGGQSDTSPITLEESWGEAELGEYPHYMLKEIYEQPEALRHCISGRLNAKTGNARLGGMHLTAKQLRKVPHVRLLGCGTALNAALIGQQLIERLARIPAVAHVSSEFRYQDPVVNSEALHFAVSQSGETMDTIAAIKEIQLKGGDVHGVVNVVGSTIARLCGQGVYIHSGPEQSVASTKAFSNMVAALTIFAVQIGRARQLSANEARVLAKGLQEVPDLIERYLADPGPIDEAVAMVLEAPSLLFLGRGLSANVAKEGALKVMELTYIPCLAYPAGEMKHGPIALLEEGRPVVVVAPDDAVKDKVASAIHECKARGARIILVCTEGDELAQEADVAIQVPRTHTLCSPLLTVLPLQLLAYRTALALELDVDRPRNLAKSVTVE
ncbi:MAG: glutamine--fructose-6-phosphate transaminase (isomerizing) [Euryarchaeota archaeon]|nr:glutamine--fructose-6-phosphate transaminase (isomerizing) [Euryarchaeota archaeon]